MNEPVILVIDDDEFSLQNMSLTLQKAGANVLTAGSARRAKTIVESTHCHVIVTDVKMPGMDGIAFAEWVRDRRPDTKFVVVTGYADEEAVIRALRLGINEFLKKPYRNRELLLSVQKLLEQYSIEDENRKLREQIEAEHTVMKAELRQRENATPSEIIGTDPQIQHVRDLARAVASSGVNALIRGENGVGKELVAQDIRRHSRRSNAPFIAVNCAAISSSLFESEMFGHVKGAFTGAHADRPGFFELANGGILFLDEVTEIPPTTQAKLLRVLESRVIRRVGDTKDIAIDVQVISATNRQINEAITAGYLRMDLYYRLATVEIEVPPLRSRPGDIPALAHHFLTTYERLFGKTADTLSDEALTFLQRHHWPGNVRQLANVMKQWVLFGAEHAIRTLGAHEGLGASESRSSAVMRFDFVRGTMEEIEQAKYELVRTLMLRYNGNKSRVAKHMGLSYPGLLKILKRMELVDAN